jgi:hypothetical protein
MTTKAAFVALTPRYEIYQGELIASIVLRGHLYVVAVLLPPFVQKDPLRFPGTLRAAHVKAGRAIADMMNQVLAEGGCR